MEGKVRHVAGHGRELEEDVMESIDKLVEERHGAVGVGVFMCVLFRIRSTSSCCSSCTVILKLY